MPKPEADGNGLITILVTLKDQAQARMDLAREFRTKLMAALEEVDSSASRTARRMARRLARPEGARGWKRADTPRRSSRETAPTWTRAKR